jgi:hypothetical protein
MSDPATFSLALRVIGRAMDTARCPPNSARHFRHPSDGYFYRRVGRGEFVIAAVGAEAKANHAASGRSAGSHGAPRYSPGQ